MSAQDQPQQILPNQDSPVISESANPSSSEPVSQPPVSPPTSAPSDAWQAEKGILSQALNEQQGEIVRLRRELESRNQQAQAPAAEIPADEFWKNPVPNIAQLVDAQMQKQVGPIQEMLKNFQKENQYDKLKKVYRANPAFAQIEAHVDSLFQQHSMEPNTNNMNLAIQLVMGAIATGQIKLNNAVPVSNTMPLVTPPNLPPSPPPVPRNNNNTGPKVELTEAQKKAARIYGMTEEEFAANLDEGVFVPEIKKPAPAGGNQ